MSIWKKSQLEEAAILKMTPKGGVSMNFFWETHFSVNGTV